MNIEMCKHKIQTNLNEIVGRMKYQKFTATSYE